MIEVNYKLMDEKCFKNYIGFLTDQLYKILRMREEKCDTLIDFMESLQREMIGSTELIEFLKYNTRFISLLCKIQFLISEPDIEYKIFRKEILSCMSIMNNIKEGGFVDVSKGSTYQ